MPSIRLLAALALLALAACTTTPPRQPAAEPDPEQPEPARPSPAPAPAACTTCGRIERIDVITGASTAKPQSAVLGGVVGGVLSKPTTATADTGGSRSYRLVVLLDNGRRLILTQRQLAAGTKPGVRVRVDRSRVVLLR